MKDKLREIVFELIKLIKQTVAYSYIYHMLLII